jgi:hypothetical protein
MSIETAVLEKLRTLSPDQQREVLEFVESLQPPSSAQKPVRNIRGLWAGLGIHISEDDIAESRREMWGNFPRDIR